MLLSIGGIVSLNKQIELLETNTKSGGGKIGWNGARRADTSNISWKVSIEFIIVR